MIPYNTFQNTALLLLRLVLATIFAYAGYAKISFWTEVPEGTSDGMARLVKFLSIAEPLGALAVAAGVLTRWAAGALGVVMLGAIYVMQVDYHIGFVTTQSAGWNFPLMIFAGCMVLLAFGPGDWALQKFPKSKGS